MIRLIGILFLPRENKRAPLPSFRPLPETVCPSKTSRCTYPSCPCAVSFAPNDFIEPTPDERYRHNYEQIFGSKKGDVS